MSNQKITLNQRTEIFAALGNRIDNITDHEFYELARRAQNENNWFTEQSVKKAFKGIGHLLKKNSLQNWIENYELEPITPKVVGVVMAGNIPAVGFHDLLSVVISGHHLAIKASSNDEVLLKWIVQELIELEPALSSRITFEDRLNKVDAIIATGSDNSARYFEYYFSKKPHIIRKNRTSCAILDGNESTEDIKNLGHDIFAYYGLGCRNVSKIYVPRNFDFIKFLDGLQSFEGVIDHHKYKNNYDYNKSIYLVNSEPHLDTGYLLLKESEDLVSPISVIYYEYFNNKKHLDELLNQNQEKIQCVVGNSALATVPFGDAQFPDIWDYADGVDTLSFLCSF